MNDDLKEILEKHGIYYKVIPSSLVPNNSGLIIAMENYYPNNSKELGLSIALSLNSTNWDNKCWLSVKINNTTDSNIPRYHQEYNEFEYNGIHYYPYSINTSSYKISDILAICDGLYKFVQKYSNNLTTSTILAIGDDLLNKFKNTKFCVVGCGGVGALFAEMLVRTGAENLVLIDGGKVEHKNLNRTPFILDDIGCFKVKALEKRLKLINKTVNVEAIARDFGCHIEGDTDRQKVRDAVANSNITIIVIDKNNIRIECEKLLNDMQEPYLAIGVEINENFSKFVCGWKRQTPESERNLEGYGENNGSYMAIVSEAVSAGFSLMMHHMKDGDFKKEKFIERKYTNYFPVDNRQEQ